MSKKFESAQPTAANPSTELASVKAKLVLATATVAALVEQTPAVESGGVEAIEKHRIAVQKAKDLVLYLRRVAGNLDAKLVTTRADEAEAAARAAYAEAAAALEASADEIIKAAPGVRTKVLAITTAAQAATAVARLANANLPKGRKPLLLLEDDPRLRSNGETITESRGLFSNVRPVTLYDAEFWAKPAQPSAAAPTPAPRAPEYHPINNPAPRPEGAPVGFSQPKFIPLPIFAESADAADDARKTA